MGPELGLRVKADGDFVKAGVADTNPSELENLTEYDPGATVPETTKLPVIRKVTAEMLQDTAVGSPSGVLYKEAQPAAASAALKPEPATDTSVKDSPLVGFIVIAGVTAKLPVPTFPAAVITVTVQVPPCAFAFTVKDAVRAPEELTVQVGVGTPAKRFDPAGAVMLLHAPASAAVKVPVTLTAPIVVGPENGVIVSVTGAPLMNVAVAVSKGGPTPTPVTETV
jgi:hypothetical protein